MRKFLLVLGIAGFSLLASQSALAGGRYHGGHHHGGHYSSDDWVPFAIGAVTGAVIGHAMAQPAYPPPPPARVEYRYYESEPPPRVIERRYYYERRYAPPPQIYEERHYQGGSGD